MKPNSFAALSVLLALLAMPVHTLATGGPPINIKIKNPDKLGANGLLLSVTGSW